MPDSSPSDDPLQPAEALVPVTGEIVHEQTVRAYVPMPPPIETTVKAPMPTAPTHEQTVRAWVPTPPPNTPGGCRERPRVEPMVEMVEPAVETVETVEPAVEPAVEPTVEPTVEMVEPVEPESDVEEVDLDEVDLDEGEPAVDVRALVTDLIDIPVPRSEQPTVPESAAKPKPTPTLRRTDPPAVSGEVSVKEAEPTGLFDSPPPAAARARLRGDTAPAGPPAELGPRRADPPSISGEVAVSAATRDEPEVPRATDVYVMPMTASGAQPVMSSAGPQVAMPMSSSGSIPIVVPPRRASTDPSGMQTHSEITGPQPHGQGDVTGPQSVLSDRATRDSVVLWTLAGALVVLALGVVMVVLSWVR